MKFSINHVKNACAFGLKKHSPEILVFTGIAGMITSAVMACKATRQLDNVLEDHSEHVEEVHEQFETASEDPAEKKALAKVYAKTGLELTKLYAPAVIVGSLSVASILASNNIMKKRNAALAAAYTAIDTSFKQYRSRVVERFGQAVDQELHTGSHQEKIDTVETDENGKEKKVKKSVTVMDKDLPSDYARWFAYGEARGAEPNADYNAFFLKAQQELANHILLANGFLFLNEVYDMLGIERSIAGQSVGWVYDKNKDDHGDNYVDFGIQEVYRKKSDEPGDYEKVYLLDFNVDGSILNHSLRKGLMAE